IQQVRRSIVKVQAGNSWGTGFAIATKTFVTCSHVIDSAVNVDLVLDGGAHTTARVISPGLDALDLAVLYAAEADIEPLQLAPFLEDFQNAQRYARDQAKLLGIKGSAAMGVVQDEEGTVLFKEFDTADAQQAFIDLTEHLRQFTNVGIGYAISTQYVRGWT